MDADNSFYVKFIATEAPTFFGYIISVLAMVSNINEDMGVHASLALKTNWHTTVNRAQIPGKKDHPGLNGLNGYHRTNINIFSKGWGGERNHEKHQHKWWYGWNQLTHHIESSTNPGKKDHPGLNSYHRTNIDISLKGWRGEKNYEKKKNTWNIRRLVNETIIPAT